MIQHKRLLCVAVLLGLAGSLLPLANAGPFRTVQIPTKEPPLFGKQPQIPPPPPWLNQQPIPVPVVPGPVLPGPIMPGPVMPAPIMPGSIVQPMPQFIEVPCPPIDPPSPLVKIQVRVAACGLEG